MVRVRSKSDRSEEYLKAPWPIARNYLRSWFAIDIVSASVIIFDFVSIASCNNDPTSCSAATGTNSGTDELGNLRLLRSALAALRTHVPRI